MKFYIMRHGQTDWNKKGKIQGKTDIELNEEGIEQAKEARKVLENYPIDMIVASPLKRARKTAEIINETRKVPIMFDKALEERGFGYFEGKIRKEIHDEILDSEILDNYSLNKEYKGVETIRGLCDRVWRLLNELKEEYADKNILLVTHGGVTRAISGYFNGVNDKGILEDLDLQNCEIRRYEIKD
mgnify:CR=1 FL=1